MFLEVTVVLGRLKFPKYLQAVLVQTALNDLYILDYPVRSLHKILEYLEVRKGKEKFKSNLYFLIKLCIAKTI